MTFPGNPPHLRYDNNPALRAARDEDSIEKWLCEKDGLGAAYAVLTDAGIVCNIPEGKQVIICRVCYGLRTLNDTMGTYMVSCDAVDGGGNPTTLGHCFACSTGAANLGCEQFGEPICVPLCVKYSSGARSVSMTAKANDAAAKVMVAWHGWVEDEGI